MIIIENKTTNQSFSFYLDDLESHEFCPIDEQNVYDLIVYKKNGKNLLIKIAKCPENLTTWQYFINSWKEGKLNDQTLFLTFV